MNWEAIGAIGEAIAAVTVIVTLVYLAYQIRHNTQVAQSAATQGLSEQIGQVYATLAADAELSLIFAKGLADPEELSNQEMVRFMSFFQYMAFGMQNWVFQTQHQSVDDDTFMNITSLMKGPGATPGFRYFWEQRGHAYSPAFQEYVRVNLLSVDADESYRPLGYRAEINDGA